MVYSARVCLRPQSLGICPCFSAHITFTINFIPQVGNMCWTQTASTVKNRVGCDNSTYILCTSTNWNDSVAWSSGKEMITTASLWHNTAARITLPLKQLLLCWVSVISCVSCNVFFHANRSVRFFELSWYWSWSDVIKKRSTGHVIQRYGNVSACVLTLESPDFLGICGCRRNSAIAWHESSSWMTYLFQFSKSWTWLDSENQGNYDGAPEAVQTPVGPRDFFLASSGEAPKAPALPLQLHATPAFTQGH